MLEGHPGSPALPASCPRHVPRGHLAGLPLCPVQATCHVAVLLASLSVFFLS